MGRNGELFQRIVTIANAQNDRDPERFFAAVAELLRELHSNRVRIRGSRNDLMERGRDEYLLVLVERARRYRSRVDAFAARWGCMVGSLPTRLRHDVRDYFHDAYYAAFFAARFGLVSQHFPDRTSHKDLPKVLARLASVNPAPAMHVVLGNAPPSTTVFARTQTALEMLQPHRNNADYAMSATTLTTLAQGPLTA